MRTYSRKRPECKVIEDVHNLCRLCLGKPQEAVPIFPDNSDSVCVALALRIMICVGLEIKREECLPNTICIECSTELHRYYTFRKKCETSYKKLKAHLEALKNTKIIEITKQHNVKQENNVDENELNSLSTTKEDLFAEIHFDNHMEIESDSIGKEESGEGFVKIDLPAKTDGIDLRDDIQEENQEIPLEMEIEMNENECTESEENPVVIKYITTNYKPCYKKQNNIAACSICDKSFTTRSAAVRHQRGHSGERPHACATCGRRFAQKAVLLRHQLVHEEHRPFKCSSCPKSYTQRGALAAHARSHAPPHARALRLHRCTHCTKVFLHASGLSRHMTMHNGRIYVCGSCDRQYRDKSSLIRHLKNSNHAPDTEAAHLVIDAEGKGIKAKKFNY